MRDVDVDVDVRQVGVVTINHAHLLDLFWSVCLLQNG